MEKEKENILPNEYFRDIPIEFKQINQEDFDSSLYNVPPKTIIKTNEDGYISDTLLPVLENDFNNINTTVINAGVGQGKTTAILKMVEKFIKEDYVVIIAVPYKSLIEQYKERCKEFVRKVNIFDIQSCDLTHTKDVDDKIDLESIFMVNEDDFEDGELKYKIHLTTVHALLANSGDKALQAKEKLNHFNDLVKRCKKKNQKCVIIFDEIHDSIDNFKEHYIHRLWCYKEIIHKIYTVSATYNEASKEVIKYLSELTKRNIFIIESERTRILKKQSRLYINFFRDSRIEKDKGLVNLLKDITNNDKPFDMLVYSSTLIKNMLKKPSPFEEDELVNHILYGKPINRCYTDYSDWKNANKKYNPTKTNIGTNFSTGVSIEKENHSYIVIFPKDINMPFTKNKGVFTNGVVSIIQGLARQRKTGDIHIFMPVPAKLNEKSLPYDEERNKILADLFNQKGTDKKVNYSNINQQDEVIDEIYLKFKTQFVKGIEEVHYSNRSERLNRLLFPTREIFMLEKGEKILTDNFFGGSLSTYILWSAICNQFLNCDLKGIRISPKININSDTFYEDLSNLYNNEIETLITDSEDIEGAMPQPIEIKEHLNSIIDNNVLVDNEKPTNKQLSDIKAFLLSLIMKMDIEEINKDTKQQVYYRYLNTCIFHSSIHSKIPPKENKNNILEYQQLFHLMVCIFKSRKSNRNGVFVVDSKPNKEFKTMFDNNNIEEVLSNLAKNDEMLNRVFNFKDTLSRTKRKTETETKEQKCNFIYKLLIKSAYEGKNKDDNAYITSQRKYNMNKLDADYDKDKKPPKLIELYMPNYKKYVNLLYKIDTIPISDNLF